MRTRVRLFVFRVCYLDVSDSTGEFAGVKPPKRFEEQLAIMVERGIKVDDPDFALTTLQQVN